MESAEEVRVRSGAAMSQWDGTHQAIAAGEVGPRRERIAVPSPQLARARLIRLAERFLNRQLDLVGGVIEEVTLKNALYRVGIEWRYADEVLDRREFAAMYEQTHLGPVRMIGRSAAVKARQQSQTKRPLRISKPYEPGRKRRPRRLLGMTPLKRFFLAMLELARNWPILGKPDEREEPSWAEVLVKPIKVHHPKISKEAPPWQQRMQQEAFSIGLIQEFNDALDEMWGYDPLVTRHLEDMACRSLRYENPYRWLNGDWVEDEEAVVYPYVEQD
jgi:hypothetical protein